MIGILGLAFGAATGAVGWYQGRRSASVSERQLALEARVFVTGWYNDFRAWASEAIDVMSEAIYCCGAEDSHSQDCSVDLRVCRHRLSALIDRGKFFLPNDEHESYGLHKSYAYRGFRQPALDYLVGSEQIISGNMDVSEVGIESRSAALVEMKRRFVSVTQMVLEPRKHLSQLESLLKESRKEDAASETSVTPLIEKHYRDFSVRPQNPLLQADTERQRAQPVRTSASS